MALEVNYNERMLSYYPEVIKAIQEFQALISTQSLEVEEMRNHLTKIIGESYVSTADEYRLSQWEKLLGITPPAFGFNDKLNDWLTSRRDTILARLYRVEKLTAKTIADIVKIFTGGECVSYFKDGVIYVLISPPKEAKQYNFESVERELQNKIPAHLLLQVQRNYLSWGQVKDKYSDWEAVSDIGTWEEICYISLENL